MTNAAYRMNAKRRTESQTDFKVIFSALTIGAVLITAAQIVAPVIFRVIA